MKSIQLLAIAAIAVIPYTPLAGQDWYREDPATAPPARRFHAAGFATARACTVLFGGVDERTGTVHGDTWEYDGADWRLRVQDGPARQRFAACMDRKRDAFLVFGGFGPGGELLGDTWRWDGASWAPVTTAHAPAARADAQMVYDEARDRVVLFGGRAQDPGQPFADTWEFDGRDWMQRTPSARPEARFGHAMTYDAARGRTLLFGGFVGGASGTSTDTFEYDGVTWRLVATATTPSSMVFPSLTFHRAHGVVVLTGGTGNASQPLRTFAYDGTDWQLGPSAPQGLTGRQGHATAYDDVREAVVLFGGATITLGGARPADDTWELSTQASFTVFGHGCTGSDPALQLATEPGARPEIGRDFSLSVGPVPPLSPPFLALGGSDQTWAGIPLPLDLAAVGAPSCALFVSVDTASLMIPLGETAHAVLPIPLDRGLLGQEMFAQVITLGTPIATSNAARLRLGN